MPAPGWTGEAEWTGWIPFEQLPHVLDPSDHFIVTANQQPMPDGYPYLLGLEWPEPYRAQRITELITTGGPLTPDVFAAMQADMRSLHAKALLPLLLESAAPTDPRDREAVALLRGWNMDIGGGSAAGAIFQAWFLRLTPALVKDDLGARLTKDYEGRYSPVTRFLLRTLASNDSRWCDDVSTDVRETCGDVVTRTLHEAVASLGDRLGSDMNGWRWDAVHRAVFPHQGLDSVPVLGWLLNRSLPNGGDFSTVNVAPVAAGRPYEQREVPSYRQIVDLSPADDSRFLDTTGQSGHLLSPYYGESLADWQAVRHRPMRMERSRIERGAIGHLQLVPATGSVAP
jgi:penicillin amidase